MGRSRALTLANAAYLIAPYRVSLPEILTMSRSAHTSLRVALDTLMGRDHPTANGIDSFVKEIMERETDLEEYSLRDQGLKPNLPELLT